MPVRELVLLLAAAAWGATFLGAQMALEEIGPLTFLAIRCFLAAAALSLLCGQRLARLGRAEWRAGVIIGATVATALGLQMLGLGWLSSSKSGFLTALYVPAVPLLMLLGGKRPLWREWAGVLLAFCGLVALSLNGFRLEFGPGELLTIGCAVAFAVQIIVTGRLARRIDPLDLSITLLWAATGFAVVAAAVSGEARPSWSGETAGIALAMGLLGTAFPLAAMTWAQERVPPARTTVLLATEPIWAGIIGALAGERITLAMALGCGLIVLGVLVSEGVLAASRKQAGQRRPDAARPVEAAERAP